MQIIGLKNLRNLAEFGTKCYLIQKGIVWHDLALKNVVLLLSKT